MKTLVIDIGGTKFAMALFDGDRMAQRESRATDRAGGREWMVPNVETLAREWMPFDRVAIGFGGPVNFATQVIATSTHVGGWQGFPLTAYLRDALGVPVIMDNDANVGAIGEAEYGAGRGADPVFYMTLSTGIGGGIYSNGSVWRGADFFAGEIGHLTIHPDGKDCLCGAQGCFERHCCGLWLEHDYGKPAFELLESPEFVDGYVEDLALGLKACIMLLNPARIVIGGGISKAGDKLFVPLRDRLRKNITNWSGARINVVPAALADDSVLWGALSLARSL